MVFLTFVPKNKVPKIRKTTEAIQRAANIHFNEVTPEAISASPSVKKGVILIILSRRIFSITLKIKIIIEEKAADLNKR